MSNFKLTIFKLKKIKFKTKSIRNKKLSDPVFYHKQNKKIDIAVLLINKIKQRIEINTQF